MRALTWAVAIALSMPVMGCGGRALTRIDDAVLADVAVEEKSAILAADSERSRALEVQRKADFDLARCVHDQRVAEAELVQSKAELDKLEAAAELADFTRNDVERKAIDQRVDVANRAKKTAEARVELLERRHALLEQALAFARAEFKSADAKFEFEKAKLAAAKGKAPGNDLRSYEQQADLAQRDALDAKLQLQKRENSVADAERTYQERQADYEKKRSELPAMPAGLNQ